MKNLLYTLGTAADTHLSRYSYSIQIHKCFLPQKFHGIVSYGVFFLPSVQPACIGNNMLTTIRIALR